MKRFVRVTAGIALVAIIVVTAIRFRPAPAASSAVVTARDGEDEVVRFVNASPNAIRRLEQIKSLRVEFGSDPWSGSFCIRGTVSEIDKAEQLLRDLGPFPVFQTYTTRVRASDFVSLLKWAECLPPLSDDDGLRYIATSNTVLLVYGHRSSHAQIERIGKWLMFLD
jgi:hypothetical protein